MTVVSFNGRFMNKRKISRQVNNFFINEERERALENPKGTASSSFPR